MTLLAVVAAAALARWVIARGLPDAVADRLPAAVRRAAGRFTRRQATGAMLCTVAAAVLLLGLAVQQSLFNDQAPGPSPWLSLQMGLAAALGAGLLAVGVHQLATRLAIECSASVASTAQDSAAAAGAAALQGGTAIAALGEAISLACGAGTLAWLSSGASPALARPVVGGLAIGALVVGMFSQVTGTALHAAGQIGRRQSRVTAEPFRYQLDPRNPSLVLDGAGMHLGVCANRALDAFCASLLCNLACISVLLPRIDSAGARQDTLALLSWVLVIRGVGLLAALVTASLTRSSEVDGTSQALKRAQLSVILLNCCGILGASRWLLGNTAAVALAQCALLGLLMASGLAALSARSVERRARRVRDGQARGTLEFPLTISDGASVAVRDAGVPMLVLALGVGVAWHLGSASNAVVEGVLALVVGFSVGLSSYTGLALFDPIVDGACGLVSLTAAHTKPEFQSRVATLNATTLSAGTAAQRYFITLSGLLGLTFALGFPNALWPALLAGPSSAFGGAVAPLALLAGMAGAALVLVYCSLSVLHVAAVTRACALSPTDEPGARATGELAPQTSPESARPRYGDVLDQAFNRAFTGVAWFVVAALSLPVIALVAVRSAGGPPELLATTMMSFLAFATMTGISVGLITEGTWSLLSATRRQSRPGNDGQLGALNLAESVAEFAGNTLSPTAQFIVKGAIAVCLTAAPALI
jgi:hypothetical protein